MAILGGPAAPPSAPQTPPIDLPSSTCTLHTCVLQRPHRFLRFLSVTSAGHADVIHIFSPGLSRPPVMPLRPHFRKHCLMMLMMMMMTVCRFMDTMKNTVGQRTTEMALQLGLLYKPADALKIGLVDQLEPEDQVIAAATQTISRWLAIPGVLGYLNQLPETKGTSASLSVLFRKASKPPAFY